MLTDEEKRAIRAKVKEASGEWHFDLMIFANEIEKAVLAKAGEQKPVCEVVQLNQDRYLSLTCVGAVKPKVGDKLYTHPLPAQAQAQPIGYADQSEIDSIGKRGQSCLILPDPEFNISVPVFVGSAPAQAIPEGWQPIGTAPKTGIKILLSLLNIAGKRRTIVGFWVERFSVEDNSDDGDQGEEKDGTYYWREGWYESMESHDDFSCLYAAQESITNWMPLPDVSMLSASPKP